MDFEQCLYCFGASMDDCEQCPVYLEWLENEDDE